MKRKRLVKLDVRPTVDVAEAIAICSQTILVISLLQRHTDPNEAYNEWMANVDSLASAAEVMHLMLAQYGGEFKNLKLQLPDHIRLGGYRVSEMDVLQKDDLPF